jgi:hypothetical protein
MVDHQMVGDLHHLIISDQVSSCFRHLPVCRCYGLFVCAARIYEYWIVCIPMLFNGRNHVQVLY